MAQVVKNLPAMQETWVQSLGWEDPLEKGMATHSSILAWRIPWTEEIGRLQSMELKESDTIEQLTRSLTYFMIIPCLVFQEIKLFLQWLYHFTLPPAMNEGSKFSTSSSALLVFYFFIITT